MGAVPNWTNVFAVVVVIEADVVIPVYQRYSSNHQFWNKYIAKHIWECFQFYWLLTTGRIVCCTAAVMFSRFCSKKLFAFKIAFGALFTVTKRKGVAITFCRTIVFTILQICRRRTTTRHKYCVSKASCEILEETKRG